MGENQLLTISFGGCSNVPYYKNIEDKPIITNKFKIYYGEFNWEQLFL